MTLDTDQQSAPGASTWHAFAEPLLSICSRCCGLSLSRQYPLSSAVGTWHSHSCVCYKRHILMQPLLHHTSAVSTQHAVLHIQCCNSSLVAACRDRKLCAGGKRPLTLPVQANGIASYFPTLPSNGQASKQFSAPRPASRVAPSQPPIRHSCLGKRSNADAAQTDELQPTTSGEQAQWSDAMHYWQFDCKLTSRSACTHLTLHILPHLCNGCIRKVMTAAQMHLLCLMCSAVHVLATPGVETGD